jgi:hypothetical protein
VVQAVRYACMRDLRPFPRQLSRQLPARPPRRGGILSRLPIDREHKSILSTSSYFSVLSAFSLFSFASIASIASSGSIFSIGCNGSILSIGSAGSILSIGSAGSILSIGSAGSILNKRRRPARRAPDNAFAVTE